MLERLKFGDNVMIEIISFEVKDKAELKTMEMPFVKNGGIFILAQRNLQLNTDVEINLKLLDENENFSAKGKVIWTTPQQNTGYSTDTLIGVQFLNSKSAIKFD